MSKNIKFGDFSRLAENYSKYRPGYAQLALDAIAGVTGKPFSDLDVVDVGAGTGIWTRMMLTKNPASILAVEPNDDMRRFGISDSENTQIIWSKGNAEQTGLSDNCADLLTMASSFHWTDFDSAVQEFSRVLRSNGVFVALWNPREINKGTLFSEIEAKITELHPSIKRRSSGNSEFTSSLHANLSNCGVFKNTTYLEAFHSESRSVEQYLGAWRSVNDVRAQQGEEKFNEFISYVEDRLKDRDTLDVKYKTRAWIAQRMD